MENIKLYINASIDDVKIYLDATEEIRAKRRYRQMQEKGMKISYEEVVKNIQLRDKTDREKEIGALKIAEDAVYIDTSNMSIEEEADAVKQIIIKKRGK